MLTIDEINKLPVVFIAGVGRSGTTMLQNILDSHTNILFPIESKLIIHLKHKYFREKNWSAKKIDELVVDLYKDLQFFKYWKVDSEKLRATLHSFSSNKLSYSSICKIIYLQYTSPYTKEKIILIGDKNPSYCMFFDQILEVFPDAKFIHLVRDYRDNIASSKKLKFRDNVILLAHVWNINNQHIESVKQKHEKQFYFIKYEDLVSNPEFYVREICNFLDVDFQDNMLNFHIKAQELQAIHHSKEISKTHPNLLKPINKNQINQWKKYISDKELDMIEYIIKELADKYKYQRTESYPKQSYYLKSQYGLATIKLNIVVTNLYYKSPFWIRDAIRVITTKLHKTIGFSTIYSQNNFRFQK